MVAVSGWARVDVLYKVGQRLPRVENLGTRTGLGSERTAVVVCLSAEGGN